MYTETCCSNGMVFYYLWGGGGGGRGGGGWDCSHFAGGHFKNFDCFIWGGGGGHFQIRERNQVTQSTNERKLKMNLTVKMAMVNTNCR